MDNGMSAPFYTDDAVTIWHGNALDLPLGDESVDLICTSPPYFGLRAYSDGGETYGGQIGSEATPGEFLDALAAATREMARVLKPSGSIFVNLGDKYAQNTERSRNGLSGALDGGKPLRDATETVTAPRRNNGVPTKSLMLLPERYRIRCVDDLGLIARAVIVWAKPNGLPESVRDRVRRSHEDWVHLTKEPRYFTGIDEIREPHTWGRQINPEWSAARKTRGLATEGKPDKNDSFNSLNPLGKLPGSVWTIPTQPLRVPPELGIQHFAAFPFEFPRRIIRGWSPTGICVECGEGRRPVVAATPEWTAFRERHGMGSWADHSQDATHGSRDTYKHGLSGAEIAAFGPKKALIGYACACDTATAPTRPAVILDPFGGTGTTGVVAKALGRRAHLVDLSRDYCRLAQWRVNDPKELAKAGQVKAAKKAKVTKMRPRDEPEQGSLLDDPAA